MNEQQPTGRFLVPGTDRVDPEAIHRFLMQEPTLAAYMKANTIDDRKGLVDSLTKLDRVLELLVELFRNDRTGNLRRNIGAADHYMRCLNVQIAVITNRDLIVTPLDINNPKRFDEIVFRKAGTRP